MSQPEPFLDMNVEETVRIVAIELGLNPAKATQAEILDTLRALRARVMPSVEEDDAAG